MPRHLPRARRAAAAALCLLAVGAASAGGAQTRIETEAIRVCPAAEAAGECDYGSIRDAFREVLEGETIVLASGVYREGGVLTVNGVTIRGEPGAHIDGAVAEGKAALVIRARDTTIEGIECSGIAVPDQNGACIRLEGDNLTLRNVHFRDSQQGVLGGGGRILIEDSTFERLGYGGHAHGIYVNGADLTIRRSRFLATTGEGHAVKSLTASTTVEDSVIASLDGADSRLIDAAHGGVVVVRGSVLEEGPNSTNGQLIAVGLEGLHHPANTALIEGNTIIMERQLHPTSLTDKAKDRLRRVLVAIGLLEPAVAWMELVRVSPEMPPPVITGNTIIGGPRREEAENRWFKDRAAAGLPPYPELPPPQ